MTEIEKFPPITQAEVEVYNQSSLAKLNPYARLALIRAWHSVEQKPVAVVVQVEEDAKGTTLWPYFMIKDGQFLDLDDETFKLLEPGDGFEYVTREDA